MNKLLVICGPTATGKTTLALELAKLFQSELLSADSRQVYKGMDIGTGKDIPKNSKFKIQNSKLRIKDESFIYGYYEIEDVHLWLLDLARPDQKFSVAHYHEVATKTLNDIWQRGHLPIVVGGTGLYVKALIEPLSAIHIPFSPTLRQELTKISDLSGGSQVDQLTKILKRIAPKRWQSMNSSDRQNPRRLVRAIEIAQYLNGHLSGDGLLPESFSERKDSLVIGLTAPKEILYQRIDQRVEQRVSQGIIDEIKTLLAHGYSWDLPALQTLGYKEWQPYFEAKVGKDEVVKRWKYDEHAYARRQLTWFKKQTGINWFNITNPDFDKRAKQLVKSWYTKAKMLNAYA